MLDTIRTAQYLAQQVSSKVDGTYVSKEFAISAGSLLAFVGMAEQLQRIADYHQRQLEMLELAQQERRQSKEELAEFLEQLEKFFKEWVENEDEESKPEPCAPKSQGSENGGIPTLAEWRKGSIDWGRVPTVPAPFPLFPYGSPFSDKK